MDYEVIMDRKLLENAAAFAKTVFVGDAGGHDFAHTLRVSRMAERLARAEGADPALCRLAALLHDVDDYKLSPETSREKTRARAFLSEQGVPRDTADRVCHIIEEVAFSGTDSVTPDTPEGCCVQDADRLDALGAMGIARAFAYGGSHGRMMYDPAKPPTMGMSGEEYRRHVSTTLNHFYEKLFLLKDMMNTESGKAIARERDRFMRDYVLEFLEEWDGIR